MLYERDLEVIGDDLPPCSSGVDPASGAISSVVDSAIKEPNTWSGANFPLSDALDVSLRMTAMFLRSPDELLPTRGSQIGTALSQFHEVACGLLATTKELRLMLLKLARTWQLQMCGDPFDDAALEVVRQEVYQQMIGRQRQGPCMSGAKDSKGDGETVVPKRDENTVPEEELEIQLDADNMEHESLLVSLFRRSKG